MTSISLPPPIDLPAEIWTQIFDIAADEDVIFQYGLPTSMAESAWFKNVFGEWTLRTPQEALNLIQRRSYATKKAIMSTCKSWRRLGAEFLFRCLFFNDPTRLLALSRILSSPSSVPSSTTATASLGWWTRRIHLTRYYASAARGTTLPDLEHALITLIGHCPNLEIFIVDWPMGTTFGPVADALVTHAHRSLRTVHWNVPCEELPKVIWALDALPYLVAVQIDFEVLSAESQAQGKEDVDLGAAQGVQLHLPYLQQLGLKGYLAEFLEQATGWSIPALKSLAIDCGSASAEQPDVNAFLVPHGAGLIYLDVDCPLPIDVPALLELCPLLQTFAFNADWRISPNDNLASELTRRPHAALAHVGLHGLGHAFGVGYAAAYATVEPLSGAILRRSNDLNVAALTKKNFPRLERVRALSRTMLSDLNHEDGPAEEEGGLERWDRWWTTFTGMGVRLEDCTGAELGTLPLDEEEAEQDSSDEDEGDEDEREAEEWEGWEFEVPPMPEDERSGHMSELRQLLEECRAMGEQREESMFAPMFGGMGMGMGMGFGGMGIGGGPGMAFGAGGNSTMGYDGMNPSGGYGGASPGMGYGGYGGMSPPMGYTGMNPAMGYTGMSPGMSYGAANGGSVANSTGGVAVESGPLSRGTNGNSMATILEEMNTS